MLMHVIHFLWHSLPFIKKTYFVETVKSDHFPQRISQYNSTVEHHSSEIEICTCQIITSEMEVEGNSINRHINKICIYFGMSKTKQKQIRDNLISKLDGGQLQTPGQR